MEKQKQKIETTFKSLEERIEQTAKLTDTDKRQEIKHLEGVIKELDNEVQRFQVTAHMKYPNECEEFEQRCSDLSQRLYQLGNNEVDQINHQQNADPVDVENPGLANQWQVQQGNDKLKEGKARALAMLHTVNNMREEIHQIDDEVMFQREKLLGVTEKLKETQSLLNQTKRLVSFFSKAVYEDLVIKILIGLIAISVIVILGLAISIKMKKSANAVIKDKKDEARIKEINYDDIDESIFIGYLGGSAKKFLKSQSGDDRKRNLKQATVEKSLESL